MQIRTMSLAIAAGLGLAATTMAAPVLAQAAAPQAASPAGQTEVSTEEVRSFARAVIAVEHLKSEHRPQLEAATDPQSKEKIRGQAMTRMVEAVKAEGLSVERYNSIHMAQQADPALAQRVEAQIAELQ